MVKKQAKKSSKFGVGLALGAAVGAAAAALFSPKSGKANRDVLKKKAGEAEKYIKTHKLDKKVKKIVKAATTEGKKTLKTARREVKKLTS